MSRRFGFLVMSPERHSSSFPGKQKQVESLSAVWGLKDHCGLLTHTGPIHLSLYLNGLHCQNSVKDQPSVA